MLEVNPFQPGTIHIYKVPFVDKKAAKVRPVLITSLPNSKGAVMGIPGRTKIHQWKENDQVIINPEDMQTGQLDNPSVFPVSKQMVFSPHFFCGEVGTVSNKTLEKVMRLAISHQVEQFQISVNQPQSFIPGQSVIPPSGKVIGVEERQLMVEASLDGWLTTGRFNAEF